MPLFKFRVYWEEDDHIYRDIVIRKGQTFRELSEAILKAFEFTSSDPSSFYNSNDKWAYGREISSEVSVNKKDADVLSAAKTPVSAFVEKPDHKFIFVLRSKKTWTFLIALIGISPDEDPTIDYPLLTKSEGIAPSQTSIVEMANERLMEIEEQYDLNQEDMDEGYSSEDEGTDEEQGDDSDDFE